MQPQQDEKWFCANRVDTLQKAVERLEEGGRGGMSVGTRELCGKGATEGG